MNKLMARIFAVVMVVVMLGTVSFAATSDIDENGNLVSEGVAEGWADQDVVTVLAFATTNEAAAAPGVGDKIIALHQGASTNATSIPVDKTLIAEGFTHVVVLFSGNAAEPVRDKAVFALSEDAPITAITVNPSNEWEFNDKTYTNVVYVEYEFTAQEATTVNDFGFKFGENTELLVGEDANIALEEGGKLKFSAVILAVPAEKQDVTVEVIIR